MTAGAWLSPANLEATWPRRGRRFSSPPGQKEAAAVSGAFEVPRDRLILHGEELLTENEAMQID